MNQLTKTDFMLYLSCPKSLWVLKNDRKNYTEGEFSLFAEKLKKEGYEVEDYVKMVFDNDDNREADFQASFESQDGLYSRVDALESLPNGKNILYEIKSATNPKKEFIKDICFQKICCEKTGTKIDKTYLVHLNKKYIKVGKIIPEELIVFKDVTDEVESIYEETKIEIDEALSFLKLPKININSCSCIEKSRSNHCDTFGYFNNTISKTSIYMLPRLSNKKRLDLLEKNIFELKDIPKDYDLSDIQENVWISAKLNKPQINIKDIMDLLATYEYPIHFFDYETYGSAIPLVDGVSPHKQFPVQYSLHVLNQDGLLTHKEFLQETARLSYNLVEKMEEDFGKIGSIVTWHASFEKTQNKEMAKWFPDKVGFLNNLNDRIVDLEDFFKKSYVDVGFNGSTSIKKVLPIVCPNENGYSNLEINSGSEAMDAWKRMIDEKNDKAEILARDLLEYCKMDTLAMVEIFKFLKMLSNNV